MSHGTDCWETAYMASDHSSKKKDITTLTEPKLKPWFVCTYLDYTCINTHKVVIRMCNRYVCIYTYINYLWV